MPPPAKTMLREWCLSWQTVYRRQHLVTYLCVKERTHTNILIVLKTLAHIQFYFCKKFHVFDLVVVDSSNLAGWFRTNSIEWIDCYRQNSLFAPPSPQNSGVFAVLSCSSRWRLESQRNRRAVWFVSSLHLSLCRDFLQPTAKHSKQLSLKVQAWSVTASQWIRTIQ